MLLVLLLLLLALVLVLVLVLQRGAAPPLPELPHQLSPDNATPPPPPQSVDVDVFQFGDDGLHPGRLHGAHLQAAQHNAGVHGLVVRWEMQVLMHALHLGSGRSVLCWSAMRSRTGTLLSRAGPAHGGAVLPGAAVLAFER